VNPRGNQKEKMPNPPPPNISARRLWLFRSAALLLPVLFVVVLEIFLRLVGYGFDPHFFRPQTIGGEKFFVQNDDFSFRFFPRETARNPGVLRLRAEKPAGTIRIFVLGESAAMGDPEPAFGPARFMEMQLAEKFPGATFEIVNVAFTAINSHVILPIARECARHEGDFWIVYMGNNEMVGPFGAATVFGRRAAPLPYVRFVTAVESTRLGQLFSALAGKLRGQKPAAASWGGMQMFLNSQIAPDSPLKENVHRNFEKNLADILQVGTRGGAKILLNTVAVNLKDCPPFASLPAPNGRAADEQFCAGQMLLAQNKYAEAREALQGASDDDALPFRTDAAENEIIRAAAKTFAGSVTLCDAAKELAASTPETICGDETFYEHVHFNFDGGHRLGLRWAQQLEQMISGNLKRSDGWLAPAECEARLGLSDWNRALVWEHMAGRLRQAPFSTQTNNPQRLEKLAAGVAALRGKMSAENAADAKKNFAAGMARSPEDYALRENFAVFLQSSGDLPGAVAEWRRVAEMLPHDYLPHFQLAHLLNELGEKNEAATQAQAAVRRRPSLTEGWIELGRAQAAQNNFSEALKSFAVAQTQRPNDAQLVFRIGKVHAQQNDRAAAMAAYRAAIQINPAHWEAHYELGGELDAAGQLTEALAEFGAAARLNPEYSRAHFNFGVLLAKNSRLDEAQREFAETLRLEPNYSNAREALAKIQILQRRKP
jgi:tetratricopeptide (TPR) repeat protein